MTATVLYTDTDAIRSAIGVDDADIEDAMITSQYMADQMRAELLSFFPTYETDFYDPSVAVKLKLWCMWFGALRIAESPLAIPVSLSTGKDIYERFPVDWELVKDTAKKNMAKLKEAMVPSAGSSSVFNFIGAAAPAYNPITGE